MVSKLVRAPLPSTDPRSDPIIPRAPDPKEGGGSLRIQEFSMTNADGTLAVPGSEVIKPHSAVKLWTRVPINIRAFTETIESGSVVFRSNGILLNTANTAPYLAYPKAGWRPTRGLYEITATIFSLPNGQGVRYGGRKIDLTIIDPPEVIVAPPPNVSPPNELDIQRFVLVNADTNIDIRTLSSGSVIELSKLTSRNLNIRADIVGVPALVEFLLDEKHLRNELAAPFAAWSDDRGNYFGWNLQSGTYKLTAYPWSKANKEAGSRGNGASIFFTVKE